jgi:hypothetical protein
MEHGVPLDPVSPSDPRFADAPYAIVFLDSKGAVPGEAGTHNTSEKILEALRRGGDPL